MTGARALANRAKNEQYRTSDMVMNLDPITSDPKREDRDKEDTKRPSNSRSVIGRLFRYLMWFLLTKTLFMAVIYYFPVPPFEPSQLAYTIDNPTFVGRLATNNDLDKAEVLFEGSFVAAEASADDLSGNIYTGVEGGFILLIDTRRNATTIVAMLNSESVIYDANRQDHIVAMDSRGNNRANNNNNSNKSKFADFCHLDIDRYGQEAAYSPVNIKLSQCSRPLGLRLSPDERRLYVVDPLNGLFLVDLTKKLPPSTSSSSSSLESQPQLQQVSLLIDSRQRHKSLVNSANERILFLDDLAVDFSQGPTGGDIIYMTDVSTKWTLRESVLTFLEQDKTGRILRFDTNTKQLTTLNNILPVRFNRRLDDLNYNYNYNYNTDDDASHYESSSLIEELYNRPEIVEDTRRLVFPNGLSIMDKSQALLINDLGNARILKHYLIGPKSGTTELWASTPCWPDNIKRGADVDAETYWVGCGCALGDGNMLDINLYLLDHPVMSRIIFKSISMLGRSIEFLNSKLIHSTPIGDFGHKLKNAWLFNDGTCQRGLVIQYDNNGRILKTLQTVSPNSKFKLISEAREILIDLEADNTNTREESSTLLEYSLNDPTLSLTTTTTTTYSNETGTTVEPVAQKRTVKRYLYLFSAVYSYIGRIDLGWL